MMEKNIEETLSESEESKEDNGSVSPNDQLKNEDGSKDIETFCENSTQDDQLKNEDGSKDIETFCENSTQDDPLKKGDIESLCESTTQGETSLGDELCNQDPDTQDGEEAMTDVAIELEDGAKHISIQRELRHLEALVDSDGEKKPCPLCPEGRFKPCHITKLLRHLQNMHWEISTDFEDYRMCICYLPCLQSTAQNENELPSRTCAHYHCIICSRPVARRIKMIRHIKRHVEKGETQVKPSSGRRQEIFHESNTEFRVLPNFTTPQISGTFFNPVMKTNRQLILCALAVLAEEREPLECLDAFSSTGIMGLQWAKHLGNLVKVTVNDISDSSVAMIQENCLLNKMKVVMKSKEQSEAGPEIKEGGDDYVGEIEVTQMDANVLMHMRSFDFIHLDPFGTSVNYLDAAFRNVRNLGIVSVTSTDTGSLYAKTVHVAKRHYGCDIIRTEYFRELGTRIVLSAIARAAARCNKGIEVLLSVALEHFVLVIVRVQRGPSLADESLKMINNLIHCHWCEERIFQKEGNMVEENPYNQLPCDCHKSMPGRSAVMLGPLWSGPLFNAGFLREMLLEAGSHGVGEILNLLKTLIYESVCTNLKQFSISPSQAEESGVFIKIPGGEVLVDPGKRKRQDINTIAAKRLKTDIRVEQPPFYYSIHRHAIGGLNIPKLNKIMQYIVGAGYLVSRTHFDPTGIRTNAPLAKLKAILEKNSTVSNTSQSGGYKETPETHSEEAPSEETASVSDGGYKETPETHSEEAPSEETASVSDGGYKETPETHSEEAPSEETASVSETN